MRRSITLSVLFFSVIAATAFAGITVRKATLAPLEKDVTARAPRIAKNTTTGEFLAVWCHSQDDGGCGQILGRLLTASGGTKSATFEVVSDYWTFDPAIAYNPISNEYLFVYDDRPTSGNRDIFGLRLDSAGKRIQGPIKISAALKSFKSWNPKVAFNPKTGGFAVTWQYTPQDGKFQLVAASVSADGKVSKPVLIKQAQGDFEPHSALGCAPMDIAYHPPSGKLLVTYFAVRSDGAEDYWLATLDPLLKTKVPPSASAKLTQKPIDPSGAYQDQSEGAFIALHDNSGAVYFSDSTTIQRRSLNVQGKLTGPTVAAFNAPLNTTYLGDPRVVYSTGQFGTRGLLLATHIDWSLPTNDMWGQPLDSNGLPVGTPTKLLSEAGLSGGLTVLPQKTNCAFLWLSRFSNSKGSGIWRLFLSFVP